MAQQPPAGPRERRGEVKHAAGVIAVAGEIPAQRRSVGQAGLVQQCGLGTHRESGVRPSEKPAARRSRGPCSPLCLLADAGRLWVGLVDDGLHRFLGAAGDTFGPGDGLSSGRIYSAFRYREGNLWFGTAAARRSSRRFLSREATIATVRMAAITPSETGDGIL